MSPLENNLDWEALGHYRVVEKLGEGGMGVVYKGWDTHLDRPVALKVLLPDTVESSEHRRRLEREAKAASALNHPGIIAIYDIGTDHGVDYIAMEFVEGDTLESLMAQGPLAQDLAFGYAIQLADALGKAHEAGIIHRDLKPSNIMIAESGELKILDFGLARRIGSQDLTREGCLAGTLAYMSPEQAEGKPADARSDIYSFGVIFLEMSAGQRSFRSSPPGGKGLEASGSLSKLPMGIKKMAARCLQADPRRRWQSMQDLKSVLEDIRESSTSGGFFRRWAKSNASRLVWAGAALAGTLLLGVYLGKGFRHRSDPRVRSVIKLDRVEGSQKEMRLDDSCRTALAITRDGRSLIYSAWTWIPGGEEKKQLFLRKTDQAQSKALPGTEGADHPFLSPDDRWIGFQANGKLMKVPLEGGTPVTLCATGELFGACWLPEGSIVFNSNLGFGLWKVPADGGTPVVLTAPDAAAGEFSHRLPQVLPGGKSLLFTVVTESLGLSPRLALLDLETGQWRTLLEDAADARWLPTGHIALLRQGTLMAVPFDLKKQKILGPPVTLAGNVLQALNVKTATENTGAGQYCFSNHGTLAYVEGGIHPDGEQILFCLDHQGKEQPVCTIKGLCFSPRFSPDGQKISYTTYERDQIKLWVFDLKRQAVRCIGPFEHGIWTPTGRELIFSKEIKGKRCLFLQSLEGSSEPVPLTAPTQWQSPTCCTPDGSALIFVGTYNGEKLGFHILDLQTRQARHYADSSASEYGPVFSPDGRWVAYWSEATGTEEVFVRAYPGPGGRYIVSNNGGIEPAWSPDGKYLYYRRMESEEIWRVEIRKGMAFSASKPEFFLKAPRVFATLSTRNWDVSPDGRRFLLVKNESLADLPSLTDIVLVTNCFEPLERKQANVQSMKNLGRSDQ